MQDYVKKARSILYIGRYQHNQGMMRELFLWLTCMEQHI